MNEPKLIRKLLPGRSGVRGRPNNAKPVLIVEHIQEGLGNLYGYFQTIDSDSTIQILRDGTIIRFLEDTDSAWTNGAWTNPNLANPVIADLYRRDVWTNGISLTVEHEGFPKNPLTEAQIEASSQMNAYWCIKFNIPADRNHIVGHYEVGEHLNCPGPLFPFDRIVARTAQIVKQNKMPAQPNESKQFPETGFWLVDTLPNGTYIGFYQYWKNKGGLDIFGYPISSASIDDETKLVTQWFERAAFEYHPENLNNPNYLVMGRQLGRNFLNLKVELANTKGQLEDALDEIKQLKGDSATKP